MPSQEKADMRRFVQQQQPYLLLNNTVLLLCDKQSFLHTVRTLAGIGWSYSDSVTVTAGIMRDVSRLFLRMSFKPFQVKKDFFFFTLKNCAQSNAELTVGKSTFLSTLKVFSEPQQFMMATTILAL